MWRDTQLVRWDEADAMRPMGGWRGLNLFGENEAIRSEYGRGMFAWSEGSSNRWLVVGTENGAYVADMSDPAAVDVYQVSTLAIGSATWVFATFGDELLSWQSRDRVIDKWDLNTANDLTAVTNAPVNNLGGFVVTPERFLMALGPDNEPRRVEWSDREDAEVWTPAATNQAGGFNLEGSGAIMFGSALRGSTLVVTRSDAWVANYVGYPDVYEFTRVGDCTALAQSAGVVAGESVFWPGTNAFYRYNGGIHRGRAVPPIRLVLQ